jgi:hypothetical protein
MIKLPTIRAVESFELSATTIFPAHWVGKMVTPISNFFTVIAMIIRQLPMGVWGVPMKRVRLLRSRMR